MRACVCEDGEFQAWLNMLRKSYRVTKTYLSTKNFLRKIVRVRRAGKPDSSEADLGAHLG